MTASPEENGARRAREYLLLVEDGRDDDAARLLSELEGTREVVFVGAGFTALARGLRPRLPPALRAQANGRQLQLGQLRDAGRDDVEGLRTWLRRAAAEVSTVARLAEPDPAARRRLFAPSSTG